MLKRNINFSVDPCNNFYEFACGNFKQHTGSRVGQVVVDLYSKIHNFVQYQLKRLIIQPLQSNESRPFRLAKYFYLACINTDIIEERGIKPIIDMLESFGGWPVLWGDSWSEGNFDWIETIKLFRQKGFNTNVIFTLKIDIDWKNSSKYISYVSHYS